MKLSKLSIPYRAAQGMLTLVFFGFFTGIDVAKFNLAAAGVLIAGSFIGFIGISIWFYMVWRNYEFEVTEDTFDIRSGVINRQKREIPLKRIQNVDVRRNIIHRILGIAKVNLETAGGKSTEASLKYVEFDLAKDIQKKVRKLKQGLKEHEDEKEAEPLFEITERELGILSLTSISGTAVAAVLGAFGIMGAFSQQIDQAVNLTAFIVFGVIGSLSLVAMLLASAATNFSQYYGFKLFRRGDSLEYERGLVNRSEGSIPLEKIQTVSIEENPLKRLFGFATLKVETAGYGPGNQENTGAEVAVPLAEKQIVMELSKQIVDHGGFEIQEISEKAMRRYLGRYMIVSGILTAFLIGGAAMIQANVNPYIFLTFIPISGIAAYLKYRNKGFYEGEEFFYTMNGFWNRKTSIVPYYRIQNLDQVQTVFQKRFGLKTIVLDTAGNTGFGGNPKVCDLDSEVSDNLYKRIFNSFRNSRS
ncbi:MAG: PH domain-containing protein [Candidatus Nanohalobium sp.]